MATVIDLKDAAKFILEVQTKHREAGLAGLFSAALRSVQTIQVEIIPSLTPQPVDRGLFRAGWHAFKVFDGAIIENIEPHAPFIEFGVRGENVRIGAAMIRALTEWVERKNLASGKDAINAAWAIAKSMQERGIFNRGRGFNILGRLRDKYLTRYIEEEIAREIERRF